MSDKPFPTRLVLDTSVAIKFYLPKALRAEALVLLSAVERGEVTLLAPSTFLPEAFNVLWQQHRRTMLSREEVGEFWNQLSGLPIVSYAPEGLMSRGGQIVLETGVIIYDALFLSLAEVTESVVVTADDRLLSNIRGTDYESLARHLRAIDGLLQ